jgi:hypothetical protein
MTQKHQQILADLDSKGAQLGRAYGKNNVVGRVSCKVNGQRLSVCVTKRQFDYVAATTIGNGMICSRSAKTPSDAVIRLGSDLKQRSN